MPILLSIGLVLNLALVGGLVYLLLQRRQPNPNPVAAARPRPVETEPAALNLWEAYEQALIAARVQANDVQLVSASTYWHVVDGQSPGEANGSWSFVFYSPSNSHSFDVVVDVDEAYVVNRARIWKAPDLLAPGRWQAGPKEALQVFFAYGGQSFIEDHHPQATIDLHLAAGADGKAVWSIVALDPAGGDPLAISIDAETWRVVSG
ncbi:MAG TPA: hypothetical protein ENN19_17595 [Chloroflexi bacterium]|nr:hypothetical protein [Chloroflexota bacterium]